jgi:glycine/D-amino acid oxidase-like deaminating enzyme
VIGACTAYFLARRGADVVVASRLPASLNPYVPYGRQALSIDENREIFAPEIWDESEESPEAKARVVVSSRFGFPACIPTWAVAIARRAHPIWHWSG